MDEITEKHDPPMVPKYLPGFASSQSRAEYPESSYTACLMDTVVNKVDACLGDASGVRNRAAFWCCRGCGIVADWAGVCRYDRQLLGDAPADGNGSIICAPVRV